MPQLPLRSLPAGLSMSPSGQSRTPQRQGLQAGLSRVGQQSLEHLEELMAGSEGAQRKEEVALRNWAKRGQEVRVVACSWSFLTASLVSKRTQFKNPLLMLFQLNPFAGAVTMPVSVALHCWAWVSVSGLWFCLDASWKGWCSLPLGAS